MRQVAPAPFNNPDAGFAIRTELTNTIFYVPLFLLVSASTFFDSLRSSEELVVPESDATMETILRFVYPVPDPVLQDMNDVSDALAASLRYNIPYVTNRLRHILVSPRFMSLEPVRIYAIARRYGLNEEANLAAQHALRFPLDWPAYEEFEHINGKMYHELVVLHRETSRTLVRILQDHPKTTEIFCHSRCTSPASWWFQYADAAILKLSEAPLSDEIFTLQFLSTMALQKPGFSCKACWSSMMQALQPGGSILLLKEKFEKINVNIIKEYVPISLGIAFHLSQFTERRFRI